MPQTFVIFEFQEPGTDAIQIISSTMGESIAQIPSIDKFLDISNKIFGLLSSQKRHQQS
jgi:hypothetical protein